MVNIVIVAILILIISFSIMQIVKSKKNGQKCIGCPSGYNCSGKGEKHLECHSENKIHTSDR